MKYFSLILPVLLFTIAPHTRAQQVPDDTILHLPDTSQVSENKHRGDRFAEMPIYDPGETEAKILMVNPKENIDNMPIVGQRDILRCREDSLNSRKYLPE